MSSISSMILFSLLSEKTHLCTRFARRYLHLEYFHVYRTLYRSQTCALDGLSGALTCPDSCDAVLHDLP